jgi:PAS domain S-box-containing protein
VLVALVVRNLAVIYSKYKNMRLGMLKNTNGQNKQNKAKVKKEVDKLALANKELAFQIEEKEKRADELALAIKKLAFQNEEKEKRAVELALVNKELAFQIEEKENRANELTLANEDKEKRVDELTLANEEKEKRAGELALANKELAFQNEEKEKRANELTLANEDKEKRADELALANIELAFQNEEKDKRADELALANKELAFQNEEKDKRADELTLANEEKEKRADELALANKELAFQNEEKDKRADELILANKEKEKRADELVLANKEKAKRADELILANKELDFQIERDGYRSEMERVAWDLTLLIDTANAPIFGIDAQGKVNEWNQQAKKITGFNKKEVMGRDLVVDFIADDYKASVGEVLAKALKGNETANFEFTLFTKLGNRVDVLMNSTTRRDASGEITGVVGVGQDITELNQVRAEQEIERKLASAQIIQSSKLATLGEMATSVAHELNQPLNVIRMAAGNCRRKIFKGIVDLKYISDKLERIDEQTARAATIIDHMRMFGREAKESPEPIDPRNVVINALKLMGAQLQLEGIEIVTEFGENCGCILCHTIQMEQVILNLLTNARDAIVESERDAKITLRVFEEDGFVHISSEDTGPGIPEDKLSRIFEPFYTTKEMGKGTGLGLSVSYGIVRDINGTIIAENVENGARFVITIPTAS